MKRQVLLVATVLAMGVFVAVAFSQEKEKELAPLPDVDALVDQLGAQEFAARQKAEDEILKLGDRAVPALREAMRSHEDAHVRFEAERLLKKIAAAKAEEQEPDRRGQDDPFAERPFAEWDRRMRELIKRMEAMGLEDDELLEQMRKLAEQSGAGFGGSLGGGTVSGSVQTGDERIDYQQRADGSVHVRITKDGETSEYEADSMEALEKAHPDVYQKVKPQFGNIRIHIGRPDWFPGFGRGMRVLPGFPFGEKTPREERPAGERRLGAPAGFRFGVWVGEISAALRSQLKLGEAEGILVEDVVPGSLAAKMGIQQFDVIRKANGETVNSAEDIRRIIGGVPMGGQVKVEVIRGGDPLSLMSTR